MAPEQIVFVLYCVAMSLTVVSWLLLHKIRVLHINIPIYLFIHLYISIYYLFYAYICNMLWATQPSLVSSSLRGMGLGAGGEGLCSGS